MSPLPQHESTDPITIPTPPPQPRWGQPHHYPCTTHRTPPLPVEMGRRGVTAMKRPPAMARGADQWLGVGTLTVWISVTGSSVVDVTVTGSSAPEDPSVAV